jgi:hypothetical protein
MAALRLRRGFAPAREDPAAAIVLLAVEPGPLYHASWIEPAVLHPLRGTRSPPGARRP